MRLKERFFDSLCISIFTRICMKNHSTMAGRQELFSNVNPSNISVAIAIPTFKIYR